MYAAERQAIITDVMTIDRRASVADLAERLGVTSETVRRDLDALESAGLVRRVHGGAVAPDHDSTSEQPLAQREAERLAPKRAAADAAMRLVPTDTRCSLLLDAGSTTAVVAERLAGLPGHTVEGLTVITNSFHIVRRLATNPAISILSLGGRVRGITGAAVGPVTLSQLDGLHPDIALLGVNGLSARFGCSTPDPDEAAVKRAMVQCAAYRAVVTDGAKFSENSFVRFAELHELDALATNETPTGDLADTLAAANVTVVTS